MSIKIDEAACIGCGACVEVCPGNLIKLRPLASVAPVMRACIRHPRDCWGCTSCVKACPRQAISFFLGADMGGRGASLTVETKGSLRTWRVTKPDGSVEEITVDATESNKY